MAKYRRVVWTPEALRMGALLRGLLQEPGITQKLIGRALGIDQTYVSQLAKSDDPDAKPRGVGAELIRKTLEHFRVDPWYFYDFPTDAIPDWRLYVIPRGRAAARSEERRNGR